MNLSKSVILSAIIVSICCLYFCNGVPLPGNTSKTKIRIHIPVKHHTHTHVITKVKKVHVAVPIKEEKKHSHFEELDDWSWDRKRSVNNKKQKY